MKKIFIIITISITILSVLISVYFLLLMNYMKVSSEPQRYYDRGIEIIPTADYIVVPGAKINEKYPETVLTHRLDYAYNLYKAKKAPKIIVSGGFDNTVNKYESDIMYSYLVMLGVPSEDIICDLHGDNTYATLKRVKEFVGDKDVIFCSQEIYSYRAVYIAKKLNLNMNVFCSDPMIYKGTAKTFIRECLAQFKAVLNFSLFSPSVESLVDSPFLGSSLEEEL